jgi:hypothetical protein
VTIVLCDILLCNYWLPEVFWQTIKPVQGARRNVSPVCLEVSMSCRCHIFAHADNTANSFTGDALARVKQIACLHRWYVIFLLPHHRPALLRRRARHHRRRQLAIRRCFRVVTRAHGGIWDVPDFLIPRARDATVGYFGFGVWVCSRSGRGPRTGGQVGGLRGILLVLAIAYSPLRCQNLGTFQSSAPPAYTECHGGVG